MLFLKSNAQLQYAQTWPKCIICEHRNRTFEDYKCEPSKPCLFKMRPHEIDIHRITKILEYRQIKGMNE